MEGAGTNERKFPESPPWAWANNPEDSLGTTRAQGGVTHHQAPDPGPATLLFTTESPSSGP